MKLVAMVFGAAMLVGCADVESNGGGQLEGLQPEKLADNDGTSDNSLVGVVQPNQLEKPFNPRNSFNDVFRMAPATKNPCLDCAVYRIDTFDHYQEIFYWTHLSQQPATICRVVREDGTLIYSDC